MQKYPHHYSVAARASIEGDVSLESSGLPRLVSAPPEQFGGPGDRWSPETLCVAAVADCFVLTFRAIARASKLPWSALDCDVVGTLDRVERQLRFTEFLVRARLQVPSGVHREQGQELLKRAEQTCLISNSLTASRHLEATVEVVEGAGGDSES
jgi:organic hydroperoxide reductase OsmC/OhrA